MYYDLLQEVVPLAQDLQAYSNAQILLLPKLISGANPKHGDITLDIYFDVNKSMSGGCHKKAEDISRVRFN